MKISFLSVVALLVASCAPQQPVVVVQPPPQQQQQQSQQVIVNPPTEPAPPTSFPPAPVNPPPPAPKPPQITNVVLRYGSGVIWQDIYFNDGDGDSYYVTYRIVQTTARNAKTVDGGFNIPAQQQVAGAYITGKWTCGGGRYSITLQATILDHAGNYSNPYVYTMECQ